jgi:group I intron endonuclease
MTFSDLPLSENVKWAKKVLADQRGIYCIINTESGVMYIGSSTSIGNQLVSHIFNYSSNIHLQHAITLYGLPSFFFIIIEFCLSENIFPREQYWLNWLFALPSHLQYNFSPTAGSRFGFKHSS